MCAVLVGVDRLLADLAFALRQDSVQTSHTLINFKAMVFSSLALSIQRVISRQARNPCSHLLSLALILHVLAAPIYKTDE